jgi:hypothetical protein
MVGSWLTWWKVDLLSRCTRSIRAIGNMASAWTSRGKPSGTVPNFCGVRGAKWDCPPPHSKSAAAAGKLRQASWRMSRRGCSAYWGLGNLRASKVFERSRFRATAKRRLAVASLNQPPFRVAVRDAIVEAVNVIMEIENSRGQIQHVDRSDLDPEAQPYQDFIDREFRAMAGVVDDEARSLEQRLAVMQ